MAGTAGFRAEKTVDQNITVSDLGVLSYTEVYDPNSVYASNTFTAPATGFYQFNATQNFSLTSGSPTLNFMSIRLRKNGTVVDLTLMKYITASENTGNTIKLVTALNLTAGDTVDLIYWADFTGAGTLQFSQGAGSSFSGYRLA